MNRFTFVDKPNLLEKRPVWLAQDQKSTAAPAPVAAPPSGGNADMVSVVLIGGLVLAGLELGGVTHVTRWFGKTLGLSKK
jgi:hypothetical protein